MSERNERDWVLLIESIILPIYCGFFTFFILFATNFIEKKTQADNIRPNQRKTIGVSATA